MQATRLTRMLQPRSIAVLGASARRRASANQAIANLHRAGYGGDIFVVHPDADTVEGIATINSVAALAPVDVALVSVPAVGVLGALRQLAETGCASAIVPAVGLAAADGRELEALSEQSGMAICGPNTMGLVNATDGIPMVFWEDVLDKVPVGPIALVGQSGGACLTVIKSVELAGFSRIIASGNEWGTTAADYLTWLADDPATTAVGLVVESIRDVPGFVEAVRSLRSAGKPLAVLQVGRTAAGGVATSAHTSALIGQPEIYSAFFRELDIPVVRDYDGLAAVLDAYAATGLARSRGESIAVATVSGGVASLCADLASEADVSLAQLSPSTCRALEAVFPGSHGLNPFDAGGGAAYTGEAFAQALIRLAEAPETDAVLAILDGQATLSDGELGYAEEDFVAVAEAAAAVEGTPIAVASTGSLSTHPHWRKILGSDVPIFRGIDTGLMALRALSMNAKPVPPPRSSRRAASSGPAVDDAEAVAELLRGYDLPLVDSRVVSLPSEAVAAASELGFPLVVKVVSPEISHRSDVGGVLLGVATEAGLLGALDTIRENVGTHQPDATIRGFELQPQSSSRLEANIGFVTDPVFGPVISVGLGGVLVELTRDVAYALAPVEIDQAMAMIESTHLAKVAAGYRGIVEPTDLRPLAAAVVGLSRFAAEHTESYSSGDLNPAIITEGTGEIAIVDVLLTPVNASSGGPHA